MQDLTLDGRNAMGKPSPTINADEVILRGNDISNDHTEICVSVNGYESEAPPRGVVIESNLIHDCGQLPPTNHHHGVYIANARDTVVRGNVIYSNADRGVQLYPDADRTLVIGNIIDGNGSGVIFGGGPSSSSDDNLVAANVITGSKVRFNVESHWQGPVGEGNAAFGNCLWSPTRRARVPRRQRPGGVDGASRRSATSSPTPTTPGRSRRDGSRSSLDGVPHPPSSLDGIRSPARDARR